MINVDTRPNYQAAIWNSVTHLLGYEPDLVHKETPNGLSLKEAKRFGKLAVRQHLADMELRIALWHGVNDEAFSIASRLTRTSKRIARMIQQAPSPVI